MADNKDKVIIFFDWDDTLFCTSHLYTEDYIIDSKITIPKMPSIEECKFMDINPKDVILLTKSVESTLPKSSLPKCSSCIPDNLQKELSILQDAVLKILEKASKLGKVCIITNSMGGWANYVAQQFLPKIHDYLRTIDIVSARSKYEDLFPDCHSIWKTKTMIDVLVEDKTVPKHIISFGDSIHDRHAIKNMSFHFPEAYIKSIKLLEKPDIIQLYSQLEFLEKHFNTIVDTQDHLDYMLSVQSFVDTNNCIGSSEDINDLQNENIFNELK